MAQTNSTIHRIARETWQRASDAVSSSEKEGEEFDVSSDPLAGLPQGGMAGPRTWQRLQEIARNVSGGLEDEQDLESGGGTATSSNEEIDTGAYEE